MTNVTLSGRQHPLLVLVGGAPASGKTTLATLLAESLGLPVLSKDLIKERLLDDLGAPDLARSRELGAASYGVLYAVVARLLDAGASVIVESNFSRGRAEGELRPLTARAGSVLVHCETTSVEIVRRYTARADRGERHPGHLDAAVLPDLLRNLATDVYEPLNLDVPTIRVDTTAGYAPSFAEIVAFAADSTGPLR